MNSQRKWHKLTPVITCCCSVAKLCLTLCCSKPGFPVLHYLPEFAHTHVHRVSDVTQPSHPLLSPPPLTLNLTQNQSQWGQPTISSSVTHFSSCPQSFPASGSFPMSWLFASGGQSIGASASTSVLPMNIQGWFRIDWFDLPTVQGTLKNVLQYRNLIASVLQCSAFFMVQLSHLYMTTEKTIAFTRWTFVGKVMSLLFNKLSRFVITSFPKGKQHL